MIDRPKVERTILNPFLRSVGSPDFRTLGAKNMPNVPATNPALPGVTH
jgi:hypothetical protein